MIEALTAVAWAFSTVKAVAQTEQGKKFIESVIGKLGEKLVAEPVAEKIGGLRRAIVAKLQGNPAAVEALAKAEAFGSEDDLKDVANYLDMVARKDGAFAEQMKGMVQEIQTLVQFDDVNAQNVQQIFGGQGLQVNAAQEQPIFQIQGNPTFHLGQKPQG
jgi:hypothetical protein